MSEYIKFTDKADLIETESINIIELVVNGVPTKRAILIAGQVDLDLSGFEITTRKGKVVNSECLGFKYLYRDLSESDGYFILTDNPDDIYVAPPEPEPVPEPEPPAPPTMYQLQYNLIKDFTSTCNNVIVNGIDAKINDVIEHFSYKLEDQNNIDDLYNMAVRLNADMYYHCDGGECKKYTPKQIAGIWALQKANKNYHISYLNEIKRYIGTLTEEADRNELCSLYYGIELKDEYLEKFNEIMSQTTVIAIQTFMKDFECTEEEAAAILESVQPVFNYEEPEEVVTEETETTEETTGEDTEETPVITEEVKDETVEPSEATEEKEVVTDVESGDEEDPVTEDVEETSTEDSTEEPVNSVEE